MTKREQQQYINKLFYQYVEQHFPEYTISFDEGYGRVYLLPKSNKANDSIEYHQSKHEVCCANWASSKTKADTITMEQYLDQITSRNQPSINGAAFLIKNTMRVLALGLGVIFIATFLYMIITGILSTFIM